MDPINPGPHHVYSDAATQQHFTQCNRHPLKHAQVYHTYRREEAALKKEDKFWPPSPTCT